MPREVDPIEVYKGKLAEEMLSWLKENNKWGPESQIVLQTAEEVKQKDRQSRRFSVDPWKEPHEIGQTGNCGRKDWRRV